MNKILTIAAVLMLSQQASAIEIVSGPYIQNMTETSCDIFWRTDKPSTAWVELAPDDGTHFYYTERPRTYATDLGRAVVDTFHKVTLKDLEPDTSYRYRIYSEEVLRQEPYHVDYGGVAASNVYSAVPPTFTTPSAGKETTEFLVLNDIHEHNDVLSDLLADINSNNTDFVLFNGDMVNNMSSEQQLIDGFLRRSTELFAAEIPFLFARGNHETRGLFSDHYLDYFPTPTGEPYYAFRQGPVFFVVMDGGEDKPDSDIRNMDLMRSDDFRAEEAEWLARVVEEPDFKSAPVRIVFCHMPPAPGGWHGGSEVARLFVPILNRAGIDLMLSAHIHRYKFWDKGENGCDFPVLCNPNLTRMDVKADARNIDVKIYDASGALKHQNKFTK